MACVLLDRLDYRHRVARGSRIRKTRYERTRYYRLGRSFERGGWLLVALGIVAAASGLFGGGWLSDREETSPDGGLIARYERFWRSGTPFELHVRWRAAPEESTLWIDTAYLDHFVVDVVNPQPARVALDGARIYYTFLIAAEAAAAHATFRLKPRESGVFRGEVGVLDASAVTIRQRIYP